MNATAPDQEPSIEEILASIRQIISDDDEDGTPAQAAAPEPVKEEPKPAPAPAPEPVKQAAPKKDDVLELKDPIPEEEPEAPAPIIDMEDAVEEEPVVAAPPPPPPPPAPKPAPAPVSMPKVDIDEESVLGEVAASATFAGFARLANNIAVDRRRQTAEGVTIEDIVRDMLQPLLRQWLDDNLPPMIDRMVQKELEKLAQRALDD
ncbi:DUF2497 domain-containing protein [Micavibrio aeruginosavorus]|uniref:DUF2497 domain-containing protein n=1 Tax=Micavibrio aeruginosavorus TaxID=349221 RepID=UPI003F4A8F7E